MRVHFRASHAHPGKSLTDGVDQTVCVAKRERVYKQLAAVQGLLIGTDRHMCIHLCCRQHPANRLLQIVKRQSLGKPHVKTELNRYPTPVADGFQGVQEARVDLHDGRAHRHPHWQGCRPGRFRTFPERGSSGQDTLRIGRRNIRDGIRRYGTDWLAEARGVPQVI